MKKHYNTIINKPFNNNVIIFRKTRKCCWLWTTFLNVPRRFFLGFVACFHRYILIETSHGLFFRASTDPSACSKYLECGFWMHRKNLKLLEVTFRPKNQSLSEISILAWDSKLWFSQIFKKMWFSSKKWDFYKF